MFGFKKKKKEDQGENKLLLGMIMLNSTESFNANQLETELKKHKIKPVEFSSEGSVATFKTNDVLVAIMHMPLPIPQGDLEATAQYAYNWESAIEATKYHQSHLIVTLSGNQQNIIELYKTFTKVICALLESSDSLGVYIGNQTLLIPKNDYLDEAMEMSDDYLPLNLWMYFGLGTNKNGNFGYTYGLKEFGKKELEIIDSKQDLIDIRGFLFNMAHYVLDFDVVFQDGQTCGLSADERIEISESKGIFTEGETFKLAY